MNIGKYTITFYRDQAPRWSSPQPQWFPEFQFFVSRPFQEHGYMTEGVVDLAAHWRRFSLGVIITWPPLDEHV